MNTHIVLIFGGLGKLGQITANNLNMKEKEIEIVLIDIIDISEVEKNTNLKYIKYIQCDVRNSFELQKCIEKVTKPYSKISAINFIGYDFPVDKKISTTTPLSVNDNELTLSLELNLATSHKISYALIQNNKKFHLIFISSIYASKPTKSDLYGLDKDGNKLFKPYIYGASKAGLEKLAKDLSTYLPEYNSRINVVSLGGVDTDLPIEFVKKYSKYSPQNCMINKDSVCKLLKWLIIDSPLELNGCILNLDSGVSNT